MNFIKINYHLSIVVDHCSNGWRGGLASRIAQIQIVNALRGGERERASAMLLEIALNNSLNAEDFSYILKYCAEAPDPLVWLISTNVEYLFILVS
jgi:hypothetical protein